MGLGRSSRRDAPRREPRRAGAVEPGGAGDARLPAARAPRLARPRGMARGPGAGAAGGALPPAPVRGGRGAPRLGPARSSGRGPRPRGARAVPRRRAPADRADPGRPAPPVAIADGALPGGDGRRPGLARLRLPRPGVADPALVGAVAGGAGAVPRAALRRQGRAAPAPGRAPSARAGPDRAAAADGRGAGRPRPPGGGAGLADGPAPRAGARRGGRPVVVPGGEPVAGHLVRAAAGLVGPPSDAARPGIPGRPPRRGRARRVAVLRLVAARPLGAGAAGRGPLAACGGPGGDGVGARPEGPDAGALPVLGRAPAAAMVVLVALRGARRGHARGVDPVAADDRGGADRAGPDDGRPGRRADVPPDPPGRGGPRRRRRGAPPSSSCRCACPTTSP